MTETNVVQVQINAAYSNERNASATPSPALVTWRGASSSFTSHTTAFVRLTDNGQDRNNGLRELKMFSFRVNPCYPFECNQPVLHDPLTTPSCLQSEILRRILRSPFGDCSGRPFCLTWDNSLWVRGKGGMRLNYERE